MRRPDESDVLLAMRGRHLPDVDQYELTVLMSRTLRALESQASARLQASQLGEAFK